MNQILEKSDNLSSVKLLIETNSLELHERDVERLVKNEYPNSLAILSLLIDCSWFTLPTRFKIHLWLKMQKYIVAHDLISFETLWTSIKGEEQFFVDSCDIFGNLIYLSVEHAQRKNEPPQLYFFLLSKVKRSYFDEHIENAPNWKHMDYLCKYEKFIVSLSVEQKYKLVHRFTSLVEQDNQLLTTLELLLNDPLIRDEIRADPKNYFWKQMYISSEALKLYLKVFPDIIDELVNLVFTPDKNYTGLRSDCYDTTRRVLGELLDVFPDRRYDQDFQKRIVKRYRSRPFSKMQLALLPDVEGAISELRSGGGHDISYLVRTFETYFDNHERMLSNFEKLKHDLTEASALTAPLIDSNANSFEIARELAMLKLKTAKKDKAKDLFRMLS